jgi:hypothetical protein
MKNRIGRAIRAATTLHRRPRRTAVPPPPASEGQRRRLRRARRVSVLTMSALAAVAAVISYNDGLFLVRLAGTVGRIAYLYPLLPDGLIVVSWNRMYEAGIAGIPRPRWATAGIGLGLCLTVSMNVAAGVLHNRLDALIDGVVPVVLFVALEILMGSIRADRDSAPAAHPDGQGETPAPATTRQAMRALLATASIRGLADEIGVPKSRVEAWRAWVSGDDAPVPELSLNGSAGV